MKRIFITGMSGTGKSSVMEELRARGFLAIDTDYNDWCELSTADGEPEWIWREDRMRRLLLNPDTIPLFVSGCCSNQRKFYELFDLKVLFSAPLEAMLQRVTNRTSNPYGKTEQDRAAIISNFEQIQPLLQRSADLEIDTTTMSINEIADFLIESALQQEY
jgi:shikimate kinase